MKPARIVAMVVLIAALAGCKAQEVRSKWKVGPEFRHNGSRQTDEVRWTAQTGIEVKWSNGVTTGITYRRRDTDDGGSQNDNGVWLEWSFPLWKAPEKKDDLKARIAELEARVAALEAGEPKEVE